MWASPTKRVHMLAQACAPALPAERPGHLVAHCGSGCTASSEAASGGDGGDRRSATGGAVDVSNVTLGCVLLHHPAWRTRSASLSWRGRLRGAWGARPLRADAKDVVRRRDRSASGPQAPAKPRNRSGLVRDRKVVGTQPGEEWRAPPSLQPVIACAHAAAPPAARLAGPNRLPAAAPPAAKRGRHPCNAPAASPAAQCHGTGSRTRTLRSPSTPWERGGGVRPTGEMRGSAKQSRYRRGRGIATATASLTAGAHSVRQPRLAWPAQG